MGVYRGELFCGTLPAADVFSMRAGLTVSHDRSLPVGWHHVAAVRSGPTISLHVDGRRVASRTDDESDRALDLGRGRSLRLGGGPQAGLDGELAGVRLYGRALADDELEALAALQPSDARPAGRRLGRTPSGRGRSRTIARPVRSDSWAAVTTWIARRPSSAVIAGGRPSRIAATRSRYWRVCPIESVPQRRLGELVGRDAWVEHLLGRLREAGHRPLGRPLADDPDMAGVAVDPDLLLEPGQGAGRGDDLGEGAAGEAQADRRGVGRLHLVAERRDVRGDGLDRSAEPAGKVDLVDRLGHQHAAVEGDRPTPGWAVVVGLRAIVHALDHDQGDPPERAGVDGLLERLDGRLEATL